MVFELNYRCKFYKNSPCRAFQYIGLRNCSFDYYFFKKSREFLKSMSFPLHCITNYICIILHLLENKPKIDKTNQNFTKGWLFEV